MVPLGPSPPPSPPDTAVSVLVRRCREPSFIVRAQRREVSCSPAAPTRPNGLRLSDACLRSALRDLRVRKDAPPPIPDPHVHHYHPERDGTIALCCKLSIGTSNPFASQTRSSSAHDFHDDDDDDDGADDDDEGPAGPAAGLRVALPRIARQPFNKPRRDNRRFRLRVPFVIGRQ
jgi:hypothetical protein